MIRGHRCRVSQNVTHVRCAVPHPRAPWENDAIVTKLETLIAARPDLTAGPDGPTRDEFASLAA